MKIHLKLFFSIIIAVFFISCEKTNNNLEIGEKLEFYLLDEFETVENKPEIIESTAVISNHVFIGYDEIKFYKRDTHSFIMSDEVISKLTDTNGQNYHARAFAVTIDKEIIYTGYFWYAYSSSICDWITIDPILSAENTLQVNLAYPTNNFASTSDDPRNDFRVLQLLEKDGKLLN